MRLTDLETGEVFLGLAVALKKKYPREVQESGFYTMFTIGTDYLSYDKDLTGVDYRVLFRLLSRIDFENWITVSQQTIAEELEIKREHVSRSIKKLLKKRIIEKRKHPSDKRRSMYRFNPTIAWKGDANQWKKLMEERKQDKIIPLVPRPEDPA